MAGTRTALRTGAAVSAPSELAPDEVAPGRAAPGRSTSGEATPGETHTSGRCATEIRSPIAWRLLGLVIERPSYGYELTKRYERVFGEMLVLSGSARIYTALGTLVTHDLIEEIVAADPDSAPRREPKPHYRPTPRGRQAYEDWLIAQLEDERNRQLLFARQVGLLDPLLALDVLDGYESARLYEQGEPPPGQPPPGQPPQAGPPGASLPKTRPQSGSGRSGADADAIAMRLARDDERRAIEAKLSWLEYARKELEAAIEERE